MQEIISAPTSPPYSITRAGTHAGRERLLPPPPVTRLGGQIDTCTVLVRALPAASAALAFSVSAT